MMRSISLLLNAVVCFIFITACTNQANPNNNTEDGWCADSYQICSQSFCNCTDASVGGINCSSLDKSGCTCWYKEGYGNNGIPIGSTCGLYCVDKTRWTDCKN